MIAKLRRARSGRSEAGTGHRLARRHFTMQDERPPHIEEVEIEAVEPFLRGLLFTDGTVTRALGVQTLAPVSVEPVSQLHVAMPADVAGYLEVEREGESIRRQVCIGIAPGEPPVLWAESHLLPERLPPGFLGLLDGAPDGIGQSLQRFALESYRELLWFGLDSTPEWAAAEPANAVGAIRRLYRIVNGGRPAILISESFAVEYRAETYCLTGLSEVSR
jgi:chorismate-pyruvate lyase